MSQENVEIVRGLMLPPEMDIAALFRDDDRWSAVVGVVAPILHPDFECTAILFGSETRNYGRGPDGFRAFWLDWTAPWATYRTETEEITDLGDRVLQFAREFGGREGSTGEVKAFNAAVWTFRDGKLVGFDAYTDRASALTAVGRAEESLGVDPEKAVNAYRSAARRRRESQEEPMEKIYDISAPHDLRVALGKPSITKEEVDSFIHDADSDPAVKLKLLEDVEPQGYGPQGEA